MLPFLYCKEFVKNSIEHIEHIEMKDLALTLRDSPTTSPRLIQVNTSQSGEGSTVHGPRGATVYSPGGGWVNS